MGIFGNEFWNVMMSPSPGQLTYDPIRSTDPPLEVRRKLQAILYLAAGDDPVLWTGGGIVYLPPGSYQIGWDSTSHSATATYWESINNPDLFVPPNVMLWFAPGATLVLQQEVVVSISGSVRAEPQQIFRSPLVSAPARRGRVVFQTTRVHEVYPEWWGAIHFADRGEASAPGNTLAFADCLRAAHTDRTFPTRSYPALPIVLGGSYAITSELVIEP